MDDLKRFSLFLSFVLSLSVHADKTEITYISPDRQKQLETQFSEGKFNPEVDGPAIRAHEWVCEMYGMSSKMRVQRDLKLYKWSEAKGNWHNDGEQLVADYKSDAAEHALVGLRERGENEAKRTFEDQVKLTKDGGLISRLSLKIPTKKVIAYSVCKIM